MKQKTRILSGIRPTGNIHLGNYLGAIKAWLNLENTVDENFFCIVNEHALTTKDDCKNLKNNTLMVAATYIACGINLEKSSIFIQSNVPAHTQIAWYLNCITPLGILSRMTQFKDKSLKNEDKNSICAGLLNYPILMAADILAYQASIVPVGADQKQHVEFTRDIAAMFNNYVKEKVLNIPEIYIVKDGAKIMNLRDGTKKMSKSDESDFSRINLTDTKDEIANKIKKAKTDSELISQDIESLNNRPEAKNLLNILAVLTDSTLQAVCNRYDGCGFGKIKPDIIDALIQNVIPIGDKIKNIMNNDQAYLLDTLKTGAIKANEIANSTLKKMQNSLEIL